MVREVRGSILTSVDVLLSIDTSRSSRLLIDYFIDDHVEVMRHLQKHPEQQYRYLRVLSDDK